MQIAIKVALHAPIISKGDSESLSAWFKDLLLFSDTPWYCHNNNLAISTDVVHIFILLWVLFQLDHQYSDENQLVVDQNISRWEEAGFPDGAFHTNFGSNNWDVNLSPSEAQSVSSYQ